MTGGFPHQSFLIYLILFSVQSLIFYFTIRFHVILGFPIPHTIHLIQHTSRHSVTIMSRPPESIPSNNFSHQFNPHSLPELKTWYFIHQRYIIHPSQHSHLCLLKSSDFQVTELNFSVACVSVMFCLTDHHISLTR